MVFRFPKGLDPITLFHNPTLQPSTKALQILKQASTTAAESSITDTSSSSIPPQAQLRGEFELDVTTNQPTPDQLRSILEFVQPGSSSSSGSGATGGQGGSNANAGGNGNLKRRFYQPGEVVVGARDAEDAIRRFREDGGRFVRPLTVDWTGGRAVIGDNESEILNLVKFTYPED